MCSLLGARYWGCQVQVGHLDDVQVKSLKLQLESAQAEFGAAMTCNVELQGRARQLQQLLHESRYDTFQWEAKVQGMLEEQRRLVEAAPLQQIHTTSGPVARSQEDTVRCTVVRAGVTVSVGASLFCNLGCDISAWRKMTMAHGGLFLRSASVSAAFSCRTTGVKR